MIIFIGVEFELDTKKMRDSCKIAEARKVLKKILQWSCLIIMLMLLGTSGASASSNSYKYEDVPEYAHRILELVNQEREKRGIEAMKLSPGLMGASEVRAGELLKRFSHTRPNGKSALDMILKSGSTVGENIAAGQPTPADVMESWMNSPGHKMNILNPQFTHLGVGYVYDENSPYGHYWVQMFRGRI